MKFAVISKIVKTFEKSEAGVFISSSSGLSVGRKRSFIFYANFFCTVKRFETFS